MDTIKGRWILRMVRMKSFWGTSFLILMLFVVLLGAYRRMIEGQVVVKHIAIKNALIERVTSGYTVPKNLSELGLKWKEQVLFYSDAWMKPGEVLLLSSLTDSYVITFGDGSFSVLSCYSEGKQGGLHLYRKSTYSELVAVSLSFLLYLTTLIIERVMKKQVNLRCPERK